MSIRYFDAFTGIGGFTLAINNAYELRYVDRSENRGSEENKEGDEWTRLQSSKGEDISPEKRPVSQCASDIFNERPLCVGYSEIDKYASSIYSYHYPEHKNYGDITKIETDKLPDFDLLVGGFPCQSFSIAGKRRGFEDTRGTMFFELARILRAKKPRLFVFENVKGLLSHDGGDTFKVIISTITELGYDCQWQVLNSKNFGVPQNRERVFIIGHLRGTPRPEIFPIRSADKSDYRQVTSTTIDANYWKGIDNHVARTGIIEGIKIGTLRTHKDGNGFRELKEGISPTIPARAREDGSGQPVIFTNTSNGFDSNSKKHSFYESYRIRRLTPTECERLQGFPDGWTKHMDNEAQVSDTQRYKCLGNAVTVNVVQYIMEKLLLQQ